MFLGEKIIRKNGFSQWILFYFYINKIFSILCTLSKRKWRFKIELLYIAVYKSRIQLCNCIKGRWGGAGVDETIDDKSSSVSCSKWISWSDSRRCFNYANRRRDISSPFLKNDSPNLKKLPCHLILCTQYHTSLNISICHGIRGLECLRRVFIF